MDEHRRPFNSFVGIIVSYLLLLLFPNGSLAQNTPIVESDDSTKILAEAEALAKKGKYQEADEKFRQAIQLNNHNVKAVEHYALFLYYRGRHSVAIEILNRSLRDNPDKFYLKAYLGVHQCNLGQVQEAYENFKDSTGGQESRFEIQALIGQCAMLVEDYDLVISSIKNYLSSRPQEWSAKDFSFRIMLSLAFMRKGDYSSANREIQRVLASQPNNLQAELAKAEWYLLKGNCEQSFDIYQKLTLKVKNEELELRYGQVLQCLKRSKEAFKIANDLLGRHQDYLKNLMNKAKKSFWLAPKEKLIRDELLLGGDAAFGLRNYPQALQYYKKAEVLADKKTARQISYRIAQAHYYRNEFNKSLDKLSDELKDPNASADVLILALRSAIRSKQIAVALQCANRLLQQREILSNHLYYAGMAYNSAGSFTEATEILEKAIALEPHNHDIKRELVRSFSYRAKQQLRQHRYAEGIQLLLRALRLTPQSPPINKNLAILYLKQNDYVRALSHVNVTLKSNPRDWAALHIAARSLALQGKEKEASDYYRRAIEEAKRTDENALPPILTEYGIAKIWAGKIDQGLGELKQITKLNPNKNLPINVMAILERNVLRAQVLRGKIHLEKGNEALAWRDINATLGQISLLPEAEQRIIRTLLVFCALANGRGEQAHKLFNEAQGQLGDIFGPDLAIVANDLLEILIEYANGGLSKKQQAAIRLERLAANLSGTTRRKIEDLASKAYHHVGYQYYRHREPKQSLTNLIRATRVDNGNHSELRHNLGVAEYYNGNKERAVNLLKNVSRQIETANCNLAMHFYEARDIAEAHKYSTLCTKRGGYFAHLQSILEIKMQFQNGEKGTP